MKSIKAFFGLAILALALASCSEPQRSSTTGWYLDNPDWGGFESPGYTEQETGPGLVFIEGGTFIMGRQDKDIAYDWDNVQQKKTVSSFYMDETEITNYAYREYIYWLKRAYGGEYPEVVRKAYPDTNVWRTKLGFNILEERYFQDAAYNDYPVVGVSWTQANDYCKWRSDRVNEMILIEHGILNPTAADLRGDDAFQTDLYLSGLYIGDVKKEMTDLDPSGAGTRNVALQDGILLPNYRLPTEAEWEYAALAVIGNAIDERIVEGKSMPWNGAVPRSMEKKTYGQMLANFTRGRGDAMGVAGALNDGAAYTAEVATYYPNDFGLYNMAGNVAEWCKDTYRKSTGMVADGLNPYRGNVYKQAVVENDEILRDSLGNIVYRNVDDNLNRRNYKQADNINYLDGDYASTLGTSGRWLQDGGEEGEESGMNRNDQGAVTNSMYQYGRTSLINDDVKVVKGGSWRDMAYWLAPGNRRYLHKDLSTEWIGFRCAMDRIGSQTLSGK